MCGKSIRLAIGVFLILFSIQYNTFAEDAASDGGKKTETPDAVQEAVDRDRELLMKLFLQSQQRLPDPEVKDVEIEIGENPVEGSSSARLMMIQFSDYTCSHCALYTKEIYPEILKDYVDTGKLRYVVIDYPLPDNIPAINAAEAVHCASEQDKLREMHEEIMREQESLDDINSIASFIDLDMDKFKTCMETKRYASVVNGNIELGTKLKIPSVPGFILGEIDPENPKKVKGISYIRGAKPFEIFQQEIDKALAESAK